MNKLAIILASAVLLAIISALSSLSVINHKQGKQIASLKESLANANTLLEAQNKAILQNKLDTQKHEQAQAQTKERVVTRYNTITARDSTCESELKAIKEALEIFFTRGDR